MSTVAPHGQCLAKVSLGQPLPTSVHRKHTFGKKRIPLRKRVSLHYVLRVQSQAGFGRGTVKIKEEEIEVEAESEPSSGIKKFMNLPGALKLPGTVKLQAKGQSQAKTNKVIFVAGATGKVGSRTVRELLKLGFSVRAGTRNVEKAQALFEDVAQTVVAGSDDSTPFGFFSPAKLFGFLKPKSGKALEIVECNLEDAESIEPALGNAGVVVCCIGASEKEVLDVSGPYRIDFKATANLVDAASSAQVNHFVLVTSLGTQKFGFPAAVLNLFWGVLVWKAKAEKALLESGLRYTIVRPGGMERPTDEYKETHNLLLAEADKLFGGQVSNLQVAELLASIVENPDVSVNKIIEAVAETTAPLRPIRELLEEISAKDDMVYSPEPQSIRPSKADVTPQKVSKKQEEENLAEEKRALALKEREEKRIQAEKLAKAQKEKEEKRINDENENFRLQTLLKKYEEEMEAAREIEEAANSAAAAALAEKAELEKRLAEVRAKAEAAALAASQAKAVEAAVVAAARKGNALSDAEKEKIIESVKLARLPGPKESKPSSKKKPAFSFFGKAAPSTETATDVESPKETKEEQAKADSESKVKAKAEKEAAAKLAEQKKQEEKAKKEEEAKKFAEQEAAMALKAKQKEEQDKLEKEAKEQAEKEAAEAKQKEEVEARRKDEEAAEARRKEEEARRKEEAAEAKRKEEAEAKRKEEELAEAKKKEEELAEAKRKEKELAEAKKKEEELAEAKRKEKELVEAKKKEEELAEAKRKEEELAEAKKKEEQEKAEKEAERLKVEAEEKAKALAAASAAAAAEAEKKAVQKEEEPKEAPAPGRSKGFRWFWQPAEPDTSEVEETSKADVAEVPAQAKVTEQLPPSSTPLSPYTSYPGLKPPFPPIPSPPTVKAEKAETPKTKPVSSEINRVEQIKEEVELLAKKDKEVIVEEPPESLEDIEARARQVQETAAREREALEKATAAISFKWPWQKPDPVEEDSTSTSKEKESASSSKERAALKSDALPRSSRPLSPYTQFPNLKPPAPPGASLPEPSITVKEFKAVEMLPKSSTPLSPYPGFPELKPPTAPTPLRNEAESCNDAENGAVPESEEKIAESAVTSGFKWPWQQ